MPINKLTPSDNYTIIPNSIFLDTGLSVSARFVLMYLYRLPCDWEPSSDRISKQLGMGLNTVKRALSELEKMGAISRDRQPDGKVNYTITQSTKMVPGVDSQSTKMVPGVDTQSTKMVRTKMVPIYKTNINNNTNTNNTSVQGTKMVPGLEDQKKEYPDTCYGVINYLNKLTGRKYKPTDRNLSLINARLKDGYSKRDIKNVIDTKCEEWMDCEKMSKYLRPETLFNKTKFDNYLNEYTPPKPKKKIIITENLEVLDEHGNYL